MRKRMLSLALVLCLLVAVIPTSALAATDAEKLAIIESVCDTSWYTQNPDASEFYISTPAQLWGLAYYGTWQKHVSFEGKTVYLNADIDLADYPNWMTMYTNPTNYSFKGTLDGQNHVIFNLKGQCFFGVVVSGATLKNICISDAVISGGSILSTQVSLGGVIDGCIVSGTASGGTNAGAIAAGLMYGTVTNCISMATITAHTNNGAGGLVYNAGNNSSVVTNNAVLNYRVQGMRPASADVIGRVIGYKDPKGTISNNVAYDGTIVVDQTGTAIDTTGNDTRHGQNISLDEIYSTGIMDRLPASFPIPEYLAQQADPEVNMLNVRVGVPVARDDLGAANFVFEGLLQRNNVNLIEAEFNFDASMFTIEAVSAIGGLTVERVNVYGADNKVVVVLGVSGTDGAFAPEEITAMVNFYVRAAWGQQPETATLTLTSATLYSKGEVVEYDVMNQSATAVLNYRHPLDVNDDGEINAADLSIVLYYFGFTNADADWAEAANSDVNDDGVVDILDVTMLVQAIYG